MKYFSNQLSSNSIVQVTVYQVTVLFIEMKFKYKHKRKSEILKRKLILFI